MRLFSAEYLKRIGSDIIVGCGSPREEAVIVAEELTTASLMGLDAARRVGVAIPEPS
jgi:hypothetical protein